MVFDTQQVELLLLDIICMWNQTEVWELLEKCMDEEMIRCSGQDLAKFINPLDIYLSSKLVLVVCLLGFSPQVSGFEDNLFLSGVKWLPSASCEFLFYFRHRGHSLFYNLYSIALFVRKQATSGFLHLGMLDIRLLLGWWLQHLCGRCDLTCF